jgi:hypothetical protein
VRFQLSARPPRAARLHRPPGPSSARRRYGGYLSSWEQSYAQQLDGEVGQHLIKRWDYEAVTLRLPAPHGRYTPDFLVEYWRGALEFREVKGYLRPSGMAKLACAAQRFPQFRFVLVTQTRGYWTLTPVQP